MAKEQTPENLHDLNDQSDLGFIPGISHAALDLYKSELSAKYPYPPEGDRSRFNFEVNGVSFTSILRKINQDKIIFSQRGFAGAFDGEGGYKGGEIASYLAGEVFLELFGGIRNMSEHSSVEEVVKVINEAYTMTQKFLYILTHPEEDPTLTSDEGRVMKAVFPKLIEKFPNLEIDKRAATTVVFGQIVTQEGKRTAVITHSGDSRAYVVSRNGIRQVTKDHTLSAIDQWFGDEPEKAEEARKLFEQRLTKEEIRERLEALKPELDWNEGTIDQLMVNRNQPTKFLRGREIGLYVRPTITEVDLDEDDIAVLFLGDGAWKNTTPEEMWSLLTEGATEGDDLDALILRKLSTNKIPTTAYKHSQEESEWADPDDVSGTYIVVPKLRVVA
jgi:serine/threonine protein phosphatase PrpC